jgi:uncharacterized membrane protein YgcG
MYLTVPSTMVHRDPTLLEKLRQRLGGQVNLDTDEVQNQLEATVVVDSVKRGLARLGVTNALSLVIDEQVIFQDTDGKIDDLPDLVLALVDHTSVFGRSFRELRFAAEHEEAGLHLVIETRARTRHRRDEPAAVVSVGGRIKDLEPLKGETAEAYGTRVEPLTRDARLVEASRLQFESFVARLGDVLRSQMPEAMVEERKAEARLVKSGARGAGAPEQVTREPTRPGYDPFVNYYPSPMGTLLDVMMFSSVMSMVMPPPILVVNPWGAPFGTAADIQAHPELVSDTYISDDFGGGGGDDPYHDTSAWDGGGGVDDGAGGFDDGGGGFDGGGGGFDGGGSGFDDGGGGFDGGLD